MHKKLSLAIVLAGVLAVGGCNHYGCMVKRQSELDCPTDIRKTVPWCAGEDAIFHCPCGPSSTYYGARPPGWRPWPSSGAQWRDAYGAMPAACCEQPTPQLLPTTPQPVEVELNEPVQPEPLPVAPETQDPPTVEELKSAFQFPQPSSGADVGLHLRMQDFDVSQGAWLTN